MPLTQIIFAIGSLDIELKQFGARARFVFEDSENEGRLGIRSYLKWRSLARHDYALGYGGEAGRSVPLEVFLRKPLHGASGGIKIKKTAKISGSAGFSSAACAVHRVDAIAIDANDAITFLVDILTADADPGS